MSTATAPTLRTLRTLTEDKQDGVSKTTNFRVDPNLIKFEKGFNLRDEGPELDAHIEQFYQAYKAGDMVPAIDVIVDESGNIITREGHCRGRAAKRVRKENPEFTVECRQFRGNDTDAIFHMLNTGTGGMRLTPLQEGRGYLRLLKMGLKVAEIAERRHVSRVTINNGITLAEAPADVQKLIAEGNVSSTTARTAIKAGKEGVKALKEAVKKKESAPAAPAKKNGAKPEKKKKVTAKSLRGTAAEKRTKKQRVTASGGTLDISTDEIAVTIKKADVDALAKLIRLHAPDDKGLNDFAVSMETALL